MARARNIKPGFYKNEDLAECSVWARFIFPGLWMLADREGRLEDRPKRIKGELIPFDAQDVEPLLRELQARGFIVRYQIDGASYIQIAKFKEHQSPHYSEKQSVIKPQKLPEISPHIETPNSGNVLPIKRGSQPPDSLIPDSLNPESLSKALPPKGGETAYTQEFLRFWKAWPKSERKEAKGKCSELWVRKGFDSSAEQILEHVDACKRSERWLSGFVCAPIVYLNQRRWEGAELPDEAQGSTW